MDLTFEDAQSLIVVPKKIELEGELRDAVCITQEFPLRLKYQLRPCDGSDVLFLWEVCQSGKNSLKMSLHFQDSDSKTGLVRVDYHSPGHKNPEFITESLPRLFHRYAGMVMPGNHIHLHVERYKTLAWAVPLDGYEVRLRDTDPNNNGSVMDAVTDFSRLIHVETKIDFQPMIF